MTTIFMHHRITAAPRRWRSLAEALARRREALSRSGGALYGLWRSQIGRPRDEVVAMTAWRAPVSVTEAAGLLLDAVEEVQAVVGCAILPTLRPTDARPPERQGNYAFRWFVTPEADWPEFLDLCAQAWPGFEAAYDSQVIGLWRCEPDPPGGLGDEAAGPAAPGSIRSLLLTRRPDLAMWERSKIPQGAAEAAVRDALSRRYDLCDWTAVYTTTLLTAADAVDTARWA